jgi:hypothetical protein
MRQDDLRTLAQLCNRTVIDLFCFDLAHELGFVRDRSGHWWDLHGRSLRGGFVRRTWMNAPPSDRPDYREVLERCRAIEATDDPAVALARILDLEHRIAPTENTP